MKMILQQGALATQYHLRLLFTHEFFEHHLRERVVDDLLI